MEIMKTQINYKNRSNLILQDISFQRMCVEKLQNKTITPIEERDLYLAIEKRYKPSILKSTIYDNEEKKSHWIYSMWTALEHVDLTDESIEPFDFAMRRSYW
jgi:hypothetical protein